MTEEEARPENTQPKASQPDEKSESHKSLTDKISSFLTTPVSFKHTKEQKTMINSEETRPEHTQSPTPPGEAIKQFDEIKKALAGSAPEWRLSTVDPKAVVSEPRLTDPLLVSKPCVDEPIPSQ